MFTSHAYKVVARVGDGYFPCIVEGANLLNAPKDEAWQTASRYFISGQSTKPAKSFDEARARVDRFAEEYESSARTLPLNDSLIAVELDVQRREVRQFNG